jgi:hypothetical protein
MVVDARRSDADRFVAACRLGLSLAPPRDEHPDATVSSPAPGRPAFAVPVAAAQGSFAGWRLVPPPRRRLSLWPGLVSRGRRTRVPRGPRAWPFMRAEQTTDPVSTGASIPSTPAWTMIPSYTPAVLGSRTMPGPARSPFAACVWQGDGRADLIGTWRP